MRSENDHSNLFKDSGNLRFGIFYPIICIIGFLVLAQRIRRRQRTKYILPRGRMDTPSEKHGGEQSSGPSNLDLSYSTHVTHHRAPLLSACDILKPLSYSTPLPSSGYLAAALGDERKNRMEQAYQLEIDFIRPRSSDCSTSDDSALVALRTDCNLLSGTGNSPTPTDDSSQARSFSIRRSADVVNRDHPCSLDSSEARSVQKRGEFVEFLRDVNEDGGRTWRRIPRGKSQTILPKTLRSSSSPRSSSEMTLTTYPATTDPSDLAALNLSRLVDRLEHNLLSPNADLKSLRRSEYQQIRVSVNIEYARATLQALERSLPQIKPVDRRHKLQSSLSRNRQTLKQVQNVLDEIRAEEKIRLPARGHGWDLVEGRDDEDADSDGEDMLGTPEDTADEATSEDDPRFQGAARKNSDTAAPDTAIVDAGSPLSPTPTAPVLRNRHHNTATASSTTPKLNPTVTATGSSLHDAAKSLGSQTGAKTEDALATDRLEQENLTASLLDLATQLKTSSQQFQASLEAEKSVLARTAEGLDRTTGNLAAAEQRMGMLRRMTEGKGWWGRMMLYAWIFALWVVAILLVFFAYIVFVLSSTSKRVVRCGILSSDSQADKKRTGEKDKGHPRRKTYRGSRQPGGNRQ
ncbi:hypothetical protein BDW66DRAFT_158988 [Aspergillus desertorum]